MAGFHHAASSQNPISAGSSGSQSGAIPSASTFGMRHSYDGPFMSMMSATGQAAHATLGSVTHEGARPTGNARLETSEFMVHTQSLYGVNSASGGRTALQDGSSRVNVSRGVPSNTASSAVIASPFLRKSIDNGDLICSTSAGVGSSQTNNSFHPATTRVVFKL